MLWRVLIAATAVRGLRGKGPPRGLLMFLLGAFLARKQNGRKKKSTFKADALHYLSDAPPEILKKLMGELPPWVIYPEYQRVAWLNSVVAGLWPAVNEAVYHIIEDTVGKAIEAQSSKLKGWGLGGLELTSFAIGPPPKFSGIKVHSTGDSIVIDIDLRLAGCDPLVVLTLKTLLGANLVVQVADLQLSTVLRVILAPIVGRLPCIGAIQISLLGAPYIDFSLCALSGDLMAIPGLEGIVASAVSGGVRGLVWPQRLTIPLARQYTTPLTVRPIGAFFVHVKNARHLPDVSISPGHSIDPFFTFILHGAAEASKVHTVTRHNKDNPEYNATFSLPVADPMAQGIRVELWTDTSIHCSRELIAFADVHPGRHLAGEEGVFREWVGLKMCRKATASANAVAAGGAKALARVASMSANVATMGMMGTGMNAAVAADSAGSVLLEIVFVPMLPFPDKLPKTGAGGEEEPAEEAPVEEAPAGEEEAVAAGELEVQADGTPDKPKDKKAEKKAAEKKAAEKKAAEKKAADKKAAEKKAADKKAADKKAAEKKKSKAPVPAPPTYEEVIDDELGRLAEVMPKSWGALPAPGVLTVKVCRVEGLTLPDNWGSPDPYVEVSVLANGKSVAERSTAKRTGTNPTWDETFEIASLALEHQPILQFVVHAGPVPTSMVGAAGAALGNTIAAAASIGTAGLVSVGNGAGKGSYQGREHHARKGGVIGRAPSEAVSHLPELMPISFAGRYAVPLSELEADCKARSGPVLYEWDLQDVGGGRLVVALECRSLFTAELAHYRHRLAEAHAHHAALHGHGGEAHGASVSFHDHASHHGGGAFIHGDGAGGVSAGGEEDDGGSPRGQGGCGCFGGS